MGVGMSELGTGISRLPERHGWRFIVGSLLFWTVLWPLTPVFVAVWFVRRHRALDPSAAAKRERRVARLLRWYPPAWRARHGDAFGVLLDDSFDDGRDGLRVSLNVAREGLAARSASFQPSIALAVLFWWLGCVALFPQGIIALTMLAAGTSDDLWFLALYLPSPFGALAAVAMIATGLLVLRAALYLTLRGRPEPQVG
jgi:hypothetical protein